MSIFQRLKIKITHKHTLIYILSTCVCSVASVMPNSATLWTIALQAPRATRFPRQERWSGLPASPCLLHCRRILYCWATREAPYWAQFLSKCQQTFCRKGESDSKLYMEKQKTSNSQTILRHNDKLKDLLISQLIQKVL